MLPGGVTIWLATTPVDLRRCFDGLCALVCQQMGADPGDGALYVFYNRRRDRLKVLWWDRTGYALLYKRLSRGTYRLPEAPELGARHVELDASELAKILEGVQLSPRQQRIRTSAVGPSKKKLPMRE